MAFTTPCFVRVEDAAERKKLIEWLISIGHNVCDCCDYDEWHTLVCDSIDGLAFLDVHVVPDDGQPLKGLYDCGTSIELFKALAAMNDENDRDQWFVVDDGFQEEMVCSKSDVDYDYILSSYNHRKATADEIVKYFKKKYRDSRKTSK